MRVTFDDVVFDSEARTVTRRGSVVHLSPKAFDLFELLVRAQPRAVRKEEIVDTLWPDVFVEEANVRNLVAEIRSAIGEVAARAIVTLPRIGYAFRGDRGRTFTEPAFTLSVDGNEYALSEGSTVVGRSEDCDVVVRTSGVSRRHLSIRIDGNSALIEDLGSKNGTWLNGKRLLAPTLLRQGDEICVGQAVFTFSVVTNTHSTTTLSKVVPMPVQKR